MMIMMIKIMMTIIKMDRNDVDDKSNVKNKCVEEIDTTNGVQKQLGSFELNKLEHLTRIRGEITTTIATNTKW